MMTNAYYVYRGELDLHQGDQTNFLSRLTAVIEYLEVGSVRDTC